MSLLFVFMFTTITEAYSLQRYKQQIIRINNIEYNDIFDSSVNEIYSAKGVECVYKCVKLGSLVAAAVFTDTGRCSCMNRRVVRDDDGHDEVKAIYLFIPGANYNSKYSIKKSFCQFTYQI